MVVGEAKQTSSEASKKSSSKKRKQSLEKKSNSEIETSEHGVPSSEPLSSPKLLRHASNHNIGNAQVKPVEKGEMVESCRYSTLAFAFTFA